MVIGARPKMGKTTLYSQLAVNCAEVEQLPALMFSLEMPDKQIVERMIGQVSRVNTDVFYGDRYDDTQVAMAFAAGGRLAQTGNLYVDDTPGITLAHIVAESRRIKRERGAVGMVLVDYLTLMTADKADRNDLAYGIITKGLKNLAKELNCIVVLLTQLNAIWRSEPTNARCRVTPATPVRLSRIAITGSHLPRRRIRRKRRSGGYRIAVAPEPPQPDWRCLL